LTVSVASLKHSCLQTRSSVHSALEIFLLMRYINLRLLTYLLTLQCGTIMTLISPGDCTLQCGMWLWNYDSEFTKWQNPAMWYVALGWHAIEFAQWQHPAMWHRVLGSWHQIRQVAGPCNVAGGSGITCHWIRPNVRHIGILHLVLISTI